MKEIIYSGLGIDFIIIAEYDTLVVRFVVQSITVKLTNEGFLGQ
jgi:hypothetical protein